MEGTTEGESSKRPVATGSGSGQTTETKRQKREAVDYVRDLGQARALEQVQKWVSQHEGYPLEPSLGLEPEGGHKWSLDHDTGCWLLTSGISSGGLKNVPGSGRYGVIKLNTNQQLVDKTRGIPIQRNSGTNFQWHVVAFLARTGRNVQGDCSHLCERSICFNPAHLIDESHPANLSRRGCLGQIWCIIHDHIVLDLCQHEPKCIRPYYRDDIPHPHCCLSAQEDSQTSSVFKSQRLRSEGDTQSSGSSGWGNLTASFLREAVEESSQSQQSQQSQSSKVPTEKITPKLKEPERRRQLAQADIRDLLKIDPLSKPGAEALEQERSLEEAERPESQVEIGGDDDQDSKESTQYSGASALEAVADQLIEFAENIRQGDISRKKTE